MSMYFKAVRPDGTDFRTGTVQWAPPEGHEGEWIVRHPTALTPGGHPREYLSVATVPTDCTKMKWPCRLLTVEAVGDVTAPSDDLPNKRAGVTFRVTGERPAREALGPQGEHVAALIDRASRLTVDELEEVIAAWDAARATGAKAATWSTAWDAAWDAARDAARGVAWGAARDAARAAARDAAIGLVVRDLISADHYDTLTRTWREAIGPIHPDDPDMRGDTL